MKTMDYVMLPDGRMLAYAEYGEPEGFPVLYFHGSPSSRLEPLLYGEDAFSQFGLRIIAPDRPGMGRSDFVPGRGFSDWPNDVLMLADSLGLGQFSVLGNSGGSGYAAACAARIPERLRAAVVVSGAWRMDWPEAMKHLPFALKLSWRLAQRAPFLLPPLLQMSRASFKASRERIMTVQKKNLPPSDYAVLEQPGRLEAFIDMYRESMILGAHGPAWDMRLYVREWDFDLDKIRMPLHLFHGQQDAQVPYPVAQRAAARLPTARLVAYPDEAHLSAFSNHMGEIAGVLVSE